VAASNSQNSDRWFHVQLYRWFPSILKVLTIIHPETLVRWHRAGFRSYWRWKSRSLGGRPQIEADLRALIRRMSVDNPLWGAPRIHGELLKLGLEVAQSSVAKYMVKRPGPPSQEWRSFLCNHAPGIAAMDLFVVPTIGFMAVSKWSGRCCPTASRRIPDEPQPRNITRADLVMTEGFGLEVDGRMKAVFPTQEAAHKSALDLKTNYPMLQVKVYDAAKKTRTLVELPSDKVAVPIEE
jgi:hypothetical protein